MAVTFLSGHTARYRGDEVKVEPKLLRGDYLDDGMPQKLVASWQTTPIDISGRVTPPKYNPDEITTKWKPAEEWPRPGGPPKSNRDEVTHHQKGQYVLLLIEGDYRDTEGGKHGFAGGYGKTTDMLDYVPTVPLVDRGRIVPTQKAAFKPDTEGGKYFAVTFAGVDGNYFPIVLVAPTQKAASELERILRDRRLTPEILKTLNPAPEYSEVLPRDIGGPPQ